MLWFYIIIFLISCALLYFSGDWVVRSLARIARFLGWREFVVAFFVMSIGASIPELFVGITSALQKIPELSFGNIVGANVIHFTLAIALCALILKGMEIESRTVQASSIFTVIVAILPILMLLDGVISRTDGIILILSFMLYMLWLFSKRQRFAAIFNKIIPEEAISFSGFLRDVGVLIVGVAIILISAQGIVASASFFAQELNVPIALIGVLIVGLGTALPETFFCLSAARNGHPWLILGNLMGCTAITATLVLGLVALIYPIQVTNLYSLIVARIFLLVSAIFFLVFLRTDRKITKKEAIFLLSLYILFVILQLV